jgi:hypothetical protein
MSFLSRFFNRRPANSPAATPAASPAATSSNPEVSPSDRAATSSRLHLVPPDRPHRPANQPASEGALAIDPRSEERGPRRRRRSRHRRGHSSAAVDETPQQHEPILFPLPAGPGLFSDMPAIERAVAEAGWTSPTPIQERSLPILRTGADLVGQAQTGSGKTAAFGIPLLERLDPELKAVQALVVVPTRELAEQVTMEMTRLGKYAGLRPV